MCLASTSRPLLPIFLTNAYFPGYGLLGADDWAPTNGRKQLGADVWAPGFRAPVFWALTFGRKKMGADIWAPANGRRRLGAGF